MESAAELRGRLHGAESHGNRAAAFMLLLRHPDLRWRDVLDGLSYPGIIQEQAYLKLHGTLHISRSMGGGATDRSAWESILRMRGVDVDSWCRPSAGLALLTFDAEEFDIPGEFGHSIPEAEQLEVATRGHEAVLGLLARLKIRATFFTTARFALARPELIRRTAAAGHEIASHGFNHTGFEDADLERSRLVLEEISGTPVRGFRMPRMGKVAPGRLLAAGYRYNSSENPTWIPGRYNLFRAPRTARLEGELLCVPASVTPRVRFPLFWISFKTFPLWVTRAAAARCLAGDGMLSLYFHPWEYAELAPYRMPRYTRKPDGARLLGKLELFLSWLKPRAGFVTFAEFDTAVRPRLSAHASAGHAS